MHEMYELKEKLCAELEELTEKEKFSMSDIEIIDKLTHSVKSINKIIEDDECGESNYAYEGRSHRNSYRRGRDSMGRYVSRDRGGNSYNPYDYGESNGKDGLITKLNHMMDEAENKSDKDAIRRCLSQIQNG